MISICNSSAFWLHCYKCMHTGCDFRSLAPASLGITLRMQRDTSRDIGRLNCYLDFLSQCIFPGKIWYDGLNA